MKRSPVAFIASILVILLSLTLALLAGCRASVPPSKQTDEEQDQSPSLKGFPRSLTDDRKTILEFDKPPKRVLSIAPSNTEIVYALGAEQLLVGTTESCDYPAEAKKLPRVSGFQIGDMEKIRALNPDLVIANELVNGRLIAELDKANIRTLTVNPKTLDDIYGSIRLVGQAVGKTDRAEEIVATMKQRIQKVRQAASKPKVRPRVLVMYGVNPIYTNPPDSFLHDLIHIAGGDDVVDTPLDGNILSTERGLALAPDVILCDTNLRDKVRQLPGWSAIPAVQKSRFFTTSEPSLLSRPGPRIVQGLEELAAFLHPKLSGSSSLPQTGIKTP